MCEIQDYSIEHKDIYFNKYSERSEMDLYITDSLQDMLDMDIKNEIATDLSSAMDFTDTLGLSFSEMSPLIDVDTDHSETWLNNYTSSFVHNIDLYGSEANAVMVNPNSVMPNTFAETPVKSIVKEEASDLLLSSAATDTDNSSSNSLSPKEEKSHLTFSPKEIKVAKVKQEPDQPATKKNLEEGTQMVIYVRKQDKNVVKDLLKDLDSGKTKLNTNNPSPLPTVRIKTSQPEVIKLNGKNCSIINANQKSSSLGTKTIISGNIHILDTQQSRAILANGTKNQTTILIDNSTLSSSRQLLKTSVNGSLAVESHAKYVNSSNKNGVGEFPKPAYSYSCLIAMALKNSRTGSLPVSEIYNFMCHHFPYFKTAPNGWKNSVRHNLSLNKCFEKIEKPSTNGSQRKGCLWAMNPAKIEKMDEEVQKWSRKDPQAIKKAMVYPENLEALERGEMKYSSMCGGDDDDDPDTETDADNDNDINAQDGAASPLVSGTGVSGGVRLLPAIEYASDASDVDVDLDDDDLDVAHTYTAAPAAKRQKSSFLVYKPVSTPTHTSRRKTPLVNRVALI